MGLYIPVFFISYGGQKFYLPCIIIFNSTLIIAVLAVALYKIKKLLNEVPQVA